MSLSGIISESQIAPLPSLPITHFVNKKSTQKHFWADLLPTFIFHICFLWFKFRDTISRGCSELWIIGKKTFLPVQKLLHRLVHLQQAQNN